MPAWALRTRSRVVSLASQQGGPWVPLRWLRRVLTEWRVVVLQGQWRGGSRSDQIPVHAVQVSVEAAGELAAQRYEYWLAEDFGVMAIPTQQT